MKYAFLLLEVNSILDNAKIEKFYIPPSRVRFFLYEIKAILLSLINQAYNISKIRHRIIQGI